MTTKRKAALTLVGALLVSPVRAQSPESSRETLTIGFFPSLEVGQAELTRVIEQSGVAVVGYDSDFAVFSDPWIYGHLSLVAHDPQAGTFQRSPVGAFRLGRLRDGEAERSLSAFLPRAARRKQILALEERKSSDVQICPINADSAKCLPAKAGSGTSGYLTAIVNRASTPRNISLLAITKDMAVTGIDLGGGSKTRSLSPGETIPIHTLEMPGEVSDVAIIVSSGSIAVDLEQSSAVVAGSYHCVGRVAPECTIRLPSIKADPAWTTQFLHYATFGESDEPQPAVGGGIAVGGNFAAWMAAIYDPTPFTDAEIAKDAAKPLSQTSFLKEKTAAERAHACGASLIAENIVLTAAHCVASGMFEGENKKLVFKSRRVRIASKRLGKGGETRAIVGMAVHAGYNGKATGQPHDIALLLLKRDDRVHYTPPPIIVANKPVADRAVLQAFGWGYTEATAGTANINMAQDGDAQRNPNALMHAPLEKMPFAECVRKMGPQVKPGMLCLVTPTERRIGGGAPTFSCRGDSGGPLVREFGRDDEVVGVTSWSRGCGAGSPSVYTDVTYYADWIAVAKTRLAPGQAVTVPHPARVQRTTRRN